MTGKFALIAAVIVGLAIVILAMPSSGRAAERAPLSAMSDEQRIDWFWSIVERTRSPDRDQDRQIAALAAELSKLSPTEIEAFAGVFDRLLTETYSWDLWGAAYVIMGGASDDGFEYFRVWLISNGRDFFEHARAQPDDLAELIPPDSADVPDFELLAYVASDVWAAKTGNDASTMPTQPNMIYAQQPSGEPFQESEDVLKRRYPKLWARFSDAPLQ